MESGNKVRAIAPPVPTANHVGTHTSALIYGGTILPASTLTGTSRTERIINGSGNGRPNHVPNANGSETRLRMALEELRGSYFRGLLGPFLKVHRIDLSELPIPRIKALFAEYKVRADFAMLHNIGSQQLNERRLTRGGIDLTSSKFLSLKNNDQVTHFRLDSTQLASLQNIPGFEPEIVVFQPLTGDLRSWLNEPMQ
jgi:hypothetical protein